VGRVLYYYVLDALVTKLLTILQSNITYIHFNHIAVIWSNIITTTTNNSLLHQAASGQHSYVRSSPKPTYSKPPSLHPPKKFPYNIFPHHLGTTCLSGTSITTTATNKSLQHLTAWGQHSYACSSSILICSKPPTVKSPKKFPYNILQPHLGTTCFSEKTIATATTNSSLQHLTAWGQHSYACSSSILMYAKPPTLQSPKKFPYEILPTHSGMTCCSFGPR